MVEKAQALAWNPLLLAAFFAVGLYFTVSSGCFQLTHGGRILRSTFGNMKKKSSDGISPLGALTSALAACMGTGNIIGVAGALTLGGPGAVFWMLVSALLGTMTCCAENILGIKYRVRDENNEWLGGSMLYIEKAFGSRKPACVFAFFCVLASLGMGNMTQANAVSTVLSEQAGALPVAVGIAVAALTGLVIFGGVRRIASVTEKTIPLACAVFIAVSVCVIVKNAQHVPAALSSIFTSAFSLKSIGGGTAGYTLSKAVRYGVSRGVFSNEAGLGSSPIVHAAAAVDEPLTQGMWGIVEVFIDTVLMCTLTALTLLTSGAWQPGSVLSPTQMNVLAFSDVLGSASGAFIAVSMCVFALSTIVGWAYYGEKAAQYSLGNRILTPYRIVYLACAVIGASVKLETVWALSDIFNALMALPNLAALVILRKEVRAEIKKQPRLKSRS